MSFSPKLTTLSFQFCVQIRGTAVMFNEISTDNIKYHKVTCYQDLIDAMTSAK